MDQLNQQTATVFSIAALLQQQHICIPDYQRPYKWQDYHVTAMVQDIVKHAAQAPYRLGTLVLHRHPDGKLDIVDGQQRFTTLKLIIFALAELMGFNQKPAIANYTPAIKQKISVLYDQLKLLNWTYTHRLSIENIQKHYQLLLRLLRAWTEEHILLLLHSTQMVVFYLKDIQEAFQFFDSQNSRGKDLAPHDLLKAYHLREFEATDEHQQATIVAHWEAIETNKLNALFAYNLYRIKQWMAGKSAKTGFSKANVALFKGVTLSKIEHYPYVKSLLISHHFVDRYNQAPDRTLDRQQYDFPFQLDQIMINGRRFFEYVSYYQKLTDTIIALKDHPSLNRYVLEKQQGMVASINLVQLMFKNSKSYREGEQFIADLFRCVMLCFMDKFGTQDLNQFTEKAFVWAFCLRFEFKSLKFASLDNYVVKHNLFRVIKEAIKVEDVLYFPLTHLPKASQASWEALTDRIDPQVVNFFKHNNYYV